MRQRRCDDKRAGQTTALITRMIAQDMLPISFVEGKGFHELMGFAEPEYTVPSRKTITSQIEKLYADNARELRKTLANVEKVALTTDAWTALTTESYVTVTCHYVLNWEMKSVVLQTRAMPERHTAENLASVLKNATESWGLNGKVTACVHDNASNIVRANKEFLEWDSNPCFAHTLQLAINDGFKLTAINNVVISAGRLVSHFHHSTTATQALNQKQKLQNLPEHRLVQHCRTRWNSIHDMFERLNEQQWAIVAVLSDRAFTKLSDARTLDLTDDGWNVMEELLPVLRSLKCAIIYPVTATLLSKHLCASPAESAKVSQFKNAVSLSLKQRQSPDEVVSACKVVFIA